MSLNKIYSKYFIKMKKKTSGVMAYTYNPSTPDLEFEASLSYQERLSKKTMIIIMKNMRCSGDQFLL